MIKISIFPSLGYIRKCPIHFLIIYCRARQSLSQYLVKRNTYLNLVFFHGNCILQKVVAVLNTVLFPSTFWGCSLFSHICQKRKVYFFNKFLVCQNEVLTACDQGVKKHCDGEIQFSVWFQKNLVYAQHMSHKTIHSVSSSSSGQLRTYRGF